MCEAGHGHRAGGENDQDPVGQETMRGAAVAVTLFVSHVNSGNQSFGRSWQLVDSLRPLDPWACN
jgi:hypothetical protein